MESMPESWLLSLEESLVFVSLPSPAKAGGGLISGMFAPARMKGLISDGLQRGISPRDLREAARDGARWCGVTSSLAELAVLTLTSDLDLVGRWTAAWLWPR